LPCALRAWQRRLLPVTLPWICLARELNTGTFGRLGSGWNVGVTLERLCRAWGEAWRQLGSGAGPDPPALAGCQANATRAIREPGCARVARRNGVQQSGGCKARGRPPWRELSGECSMRELRAHGARVGEEEGNANGRWLQARGRPRWRELSDERSVRELRARMRSRWRGVRECKGLVAAKPGGARGGGSCQVNAGCASCEPGCARIGEEEGNATVWWP
jgi:hypothetical protein